LKWGKSYGGKEMNFMSIRRESERLVVRPMRDTDFETILKGLKDQAPRQNRHEEETELTDIFTEDFCKETADKLEQYAKNDRCYEFRVFKKEDGSYVGGVIVKTIKRGGFQWAEVGYWLLNQHWGKGYGSEMVKVMNDIAFKELGFHRLEAHVNLDNIASQKTAEAAGMKFECIRQGFIFEDDEWTDNMVYFINNTNSKEL